VNVWVVSEVPPPGVQDAEESGRAAEVLLAGAEVEDGAMNAALRERALRRGHAPRAPARGGEDPCRVPVGLPEGPQYPEGLLVEELDRAQGDRHGPPGVPLDVRHVEEVGPHLVLRNAVGSFPEVLCRLPDPPHAGLLSPRGEPRRLHVLDHPPPQFRRHRILLGPGKGARLRLPGPGDMLSGDMRRCASPIGKSARP